MSRLQRLSRDTASKGVVLNEVEFYRCVTDSNLVSVSCQKRIKVKIGLHTCIHTYTHIYVNEDVYIGECQFLDIDSSNSA